MQFLVLVALLAVCMVTTAALAPAPAPIPEPAPAPAAAPMTFATVTLGQELEEFYRLIPAKPIRDLLLRYLLNDAEFQSVVRIINSYDAYMARMLFSMQPEVTALRSWTRTQLLVSDSSFELLDSEELTLLNKRSHWSSTVYGWQGFVNEFFSYYSLDIMRSQIEAKVAQNGIFAQYWSRVRALRPAYERALAFPTTIRVVAQLQANGVNTKQLDQFIRTQFDWLDTSGIQQRAHAPLISNALPILAH